MGIGAERTEVAVYWNVESCPLAKNIDASFIQQRIEKTLEQYGYCKPSTTIRAYGKLDHHTKQALISAKIEVVKFKRAKDTVEKYMLVDISNWVSGDHCPAACMLISEDLGFSDLVDMLKQVGLNFLLVHPNPRVSKLLGAAKHVWGWPQLLSDDKPLPMDEACTSLAGVNSISNLSSHSNSDDQDIGFLILMILILLCYGICKKLGLISHHEILGLLFVMEVLVIILDESEIINVFGRRKSLLGGAALFKIVGGFCIKSFIQDISFFCLIGFLAYVNANLGPVVLPPILHLPLTMLLLFELVKWFLRFAWPFILVIWDFENCRLPRGADHYSISRKIRVCLENHGCFGPVMIRAYGDTNSLDSSQLGALSKEIDVIHVNPGKDAADKRIMVELPFLARANIFASTFMLISGDSDYARLVGVLAHGVHGLKFLHCSPKQEVRAFHSLGKKVYNWPDIVTQVPSQPLLMSAASASDKHSDQDVGFIILMIATVLFVGASKRLRLISYPDYADVALIFEMWILMLYDSGIVKCLVGSVDRQKIVSENAGVSNRSPTEAT